MVIDTSFVFIACGFQKMKAVYFSVFGIRLYSKQYAIV